MAGITTTVLAVTAVAGTAYSINQQQKAASAQKQAAQVAQQQQRQQASQQRRQSVRAMVSQRSRMRAQAQSLGVSGGSAALGGMSSLSSQFGANLGYGSMMSGLSQQYSGFTGQAAQFGAQAQLGAGISGLSSQLYGYGQNYMAANPQQPTPNPRDSSTNLPQIY